jgi:hypothetical protein
MQKVKDRQKRLEERKETREAQLENIKERERQQKAWLKQTNQNIDDDDDDGSDDESDNENEGKNVSQGDSEKKRSSTSEEVFDIVSNTKIGSVPSNKKNAGEDTSKTTTARAVSDLHGGQSVTITTTFGLPEGNSSDEEDKKMLQQQNRRKRDDEAQREAGSVKRYVKMLKGKLPQKKSKFDNTQGSLVQKKGNHGASNMTGMGGAANLKAAKRTLMGAEKKMGGRAEPAARGGKGKKKRGGR